MERMSSSRWCDDPGHSEFRPCGVQRPLQGMPKEKMAEKVIACFIIPRVFVPLSLKGGESGGEIRDFATRDVMKNILNEHDFIGITITCISKKRK